MPKLNFRTEINSPMGRVFQLITDLKRYNQWLPASRLYTAVSDVSQEPVRLGTTYVDNGSVAMMGEVTAFHPPAHITFSQTSPNVDLTIHYMLATIDKRTRVARDVDFQPKGMLTKLFAPLAMGRIRKENERVLQAMKTYLESSD